MREAILETIEDDSLKALHTEVAKGLSEFDQSDERAGQIARHWQIAGDSFHECLFSQRAGIHALEIGVFHEAKSYLERSLSLAASLSAPEIEKLPHSRAQVLFSLAESLQYLAEYAHAMSYAKEALSLYESINDELRVAYTYNLLGDIAWHQGDYDEGLEYCAISHNYAHNLNDLLLMARALNRTGMIYVQQGDYDTASENFTKSLDTLRRLDAQGDLAGVLNNIGLIAYYKGHFDEASDYFEESIAISRDIGERHRAAGTLMNMGSIAGITGDFVQAETYFRDSLSVAREIGNRRYAAQCLNNLGHLAFLKGELDEAEQFLQESWPISEAIGNRAQVAQTMGNIGNIYRERGNIDLANEYYTEAIAIAFEADAYAILMEVLLSKAEVTEDLEEKCELLDIVVRHAATEETDRQTAIKLRESLQPGTKPGHPVLEDVLAQLLKNKTGS
jgi:tetratricopeptide (TPR) repeat protein